MLMEQTRLNRRDSFTRDGGIVSEFKIDVHFALKKIIMVETLDGQSLPFQKGPVNFNQLWCESFYVQGDIEEINVTFE